MHPDNRSIKVFINGKSKGSNASIPSGGHTPVSGYKLESKADINKYISDLRKLIPLLNTNDFKILNATVLQFSNLDTKELVKYLQSELKKLSKSKELTRFVTISRTPVRKQFGSNFEELQEKIQINVL